MRHRLRERARRSRKVWPPPLPRRRRRCRDAASARATLRASPARQSPSLTSSTFVLLSCLLQKAAELTKAKLALRSCACSAQQLCTRVDPVCLNNSVRGAVANASYLPLCCTCADRRRERWGGPRRRRRRWRRSSPQRRAAWRGALRSSEYDSAPRSLSSAFPASPTSARGPVWNLPWFHLFIASTTRGPVRLLLKLSKSEAVSVHPVLLILSIAYKPTYVLLL